MLVEDINKVVAPQLAAIRVKLLTIPSGHSARLARISDPAKMNAELSGLITEVLTDVSDDAAARASKAA